MEKLKVGDRVKIIKSVTNWGSGMDKFAGKVVTITSFYSSTLGSESIRFEGGGSYSWNYDHDHFLRPGEFVEAVAVPPIAAPVESLEGESITFTVKGETYNYVYTDSYLKNIRPNNRAIFAALGMEEDAKAYAFCKSAYGYDCSGGCPESRSGDYPALKRLVIALKEECKRVDAALPKATKGDKHAITVGDETFHLRVMSSFLEDGTHGSNALIFKKLGVDKKSFCEAAYGYAPTPGSSDCCPECKSGDFVALYKLVKALKKAAADYVAPVPKAKYNKGDPVTFVIDGKSYNHTVREDFLSYNAGANSTIFKELGISTEKAHRICSTQYGYTAKSSPTSEKAFPEYEVDDYFAASRAIAEIKLLCSAYVPEPKKAEYAAKYNTGDSVTFDFGIEKYTYRVDTYYLNNPTGENNIVFTKLGMSKSEKIAFCAAAYGYAPRGGSDGCPCYEPSDRKGIDTLIIALKEKCRAFKIIEASKPKPPKFKVGDYVKLESSVCGFRKGDIGQVTECESIGHVLVNVPGRTSSSGYRPNVSYPESELSESSYDNYVSFRSMMAHEKAMAELEAAPVKAARTFKCGKIWIGNDPDLCRQVQLALFERGYRWCAGGETTPLLTKTSYALYLNADGEFSRSSFVPEYWEACVDKFKETFGRDAKDEISLASLGLKGSTTLVKEAKKVKLGSSKIPLLTVKKRG